MLVFRARIIFSWPSGIDVCAVGRTCVSAAYSGRLYLDTKLQEVAADLQVLGGSTREL